MDARTRVVRHDVKPGPGEIWRIGRDGAAVRVQIDTLAFCQRFRHHSSNRKNQTRPAGMVYRSRIHCRRVQDMRRRMPRPAPPLGGRFEREEVDEAG